MKARAPRSAFRELSAASAKELLRNKKGSFSILFMVGFLFLIIVALNQAVNVANRPAPVVALSGDESTSSPVADALSNAGIRIDAAEPNAMIALAGGTAAVVLDAEEPPQWFAIVAALEQAGVSSRDISVVDETGFEQTDLLRANLATIAALGFLAITFMGTAVPVVTMRERGTLRLLGTTPLRKLTFIAAQTPVRAVAGLIIAAAVVAVALTMGYIDGFGVLRLLVTFTLGLAMFFAFAYLLASRSRNAETINYIAAMVPIAAMFASGSVFPRQILPDWLEAALDWLPSSWFVQAASADLAGAPSMLPVPVLWLLMAACTVLIALLAARLFIWDDRER